MGGCETDDVDREELQNFLPGNNVKSDHFRSRAVNVNVIVRPTIKICICVGIGLILACVALPLWTGFTGSHQPYKHDTENLIPIPTSNGTFYFTERQYTQIQNYRRGTGLILHIHMTHHAGTTFCAEIGKARGPSPEFACRMDHKFNELNHNLTRDPRFHGINPWYANETSAMIQLIRPYYHFISWEYWVTAPYPSLSATDWEDPNLVSVILMREPLSRMLAGDGFVNRFFKISDPNASLEDWWNFANMTHGDTDNFMLRVLSETTTTTTTNPPCCQGENTPRERLYEAQRLLERFTFILDVECLDEGMQALVEILGLPERKVLKNATKSPSEKYHHRHPPPEERIPYKEVYDYLLQRNKLDRELYEWSQNRSLVRCADLGIPS